MALILGKDGKRKISENYEKEEERREKKNG